MIRSYLLWVIAFSLSAAPAYDSSSVLDRAGRRVEKFWDELGSVACTELVTQSKLTPEGKLLVEKKSNYDYLMMIQLADGELNVEESRMERSPSGKKLDKPLLSTGGFSAMMLVLHPHFQPSYEYSEIAADGPERAIHFKHRAGGRSPSVLQLRGRLYPLEWQGTAWVDAATGIVNRIHADLASPMADIGLQALSVDVAYQQVALASENLLLPDNAKIEAATQRQRWRNVHLFRQYRKFSVDTQVRTEAPDPEALQKASQPPAQGRSGSSRPHKEK